MSWTDLEIGTQRLFFCMITETVAGSMFVIIFLLLEKMPRWKNSRLKLWWIKSALLMYLIPFAMVIVIGSRIDVDISLQRYVLLSEFLWVSTGMMQRVYIVLGIIWLLGLTIGIVFRIIQYWKIKVILKGNVTVERGFQKIIEENKEKLKGKKVEFYQNDRIQYPITVGDIKPQIILPIKAYTEKELYMILEHEMNHVKSHDLIWKKAGLLVTFIHWWNPTVYILLERLILQEEIECDIRTCENNNNFTMKEYGLYLAGMQEGSDDMIFASALYKSKKDLFRRLEGMVKGKKYRKSTAIISCFILAMLSMIPSYAASEGMAKVNERWIAETEVLVEEEEVDYRAIEKTDTVSATENIEEIEVATENTVGVLSTEVRLESTINSNTRVLYGWQYMQAGDVVFVYANCSDSGIVYRIGIRDSKGNLRYQEGNGSLDHVFDISTDGDYTVYIENRSNKSAQVTGYAIYPN